MGRWSYQAGLLAGWVGVRAAARGCSNAQESQAAVAFSSPSEARATGSLGDEGWQLLPWGWGANTARTSFVACACI